jgi:ATP-dependent DNA ligase
VIDGEAVILGVDGILDFNALHSGQHNDEVQLCAFDLLAERMALEYKRLADWSEYQWPEADRLK